MVMSSAYAMTLTDTMGGGKSEVCMLNSVGERTPPRGTPVLNRRVWMCGLCMLYKLCVV